MAIEVVNRQRLARLDLKAVADLAHATLEAIGREGASLTIAFVRDHRVRRLNRDYRGLDRATDVLSFPNSDKQDGENRVEELSGERVIETEEYIGDVVISTDTALSQAEEANHSFAREVSELVIHGTLHLCGYDHETDRGEMNRLELKLRRKLLDGGLGPEVGGQGKK